MSPSARKIHVGIIGSPRTPKRIDPAAGQPRLERVLVPSERYHAFCVCGGSLEMRRDRDDLTWTECAACGASNHAARRAAID